MAAKPVIFTLDDEPYVLQVIDLDLRREYGAQYRIMRADSSVKALETLKKLKLRGEAVALLLVDQRMPQMTGIEFLEQAKEIYPDAKRVLLTAYADTDAAIRAINQVKIDYYLLKPWEPPEEHLYPVLQDVLGDWHAHYRPPTTGEGIRVVGYRWSPRTHQTRDFLARNQIPYRWLDVEASDEARHLVNSTELQTVEMPLVVFPDGHTAKAPSLTEIAEHMGLKIHAERPFYDLIIVGAGPAGLAAAVYGASEGLRTVLIEREAPGGQAGTSSRIENYLGFPAGLSGADLARRAVTQARRFGVEILTPQEVTGVKIRDSYRIVQLSDGSELNCHALLIATGVSYRKLGAPGCEELAGAGVYYGASLSEAFFHRNEHIFIVGGANSAGQSAMHFASYACKISMLIRGKSLSSSMSQYLIDQIEATPNIEIVPYTTVTQVNGKKQLETITIQNTQTGEEKTLPATALFIFIGAIPRTEWLDGVVERSEDGYILSGSDLLRDGRRPPGWTPNRDPYLLESSVPGIFVAGDVRYRSVKRVASAVGEGSMAVLFIHEYLGGL